MHVESKTVQLINQSPQKLRSIQTELICVLFLAVLQVNQLGEIVAQHQHYLNILMNMKGKKNMLNFQLMFYTLTTMVEQNLKDHYQVLFN